VTARRVSSFSTWRKAVLRDPDLDSTSVLVGLVISSYMNGKGVAWPSKVLIARGSKLGLRSTDRGVRRLEETGYLLVEHSRGRTSNRYYLTLPGEKGASLMLGTSA
jgi:hypothetical protein